MPTRLLALSLAAIYVVFATVGPLLHSHEHEANASELASGQFVNEVAATCHCGVCLPPDPIGEADNASAVERDQHAGCSHDCLACSVLAQLKLSRTSAKPTPHTPAPLAFVACTREAFRSCVQLSAFDARGPPRCGLG
ncbi:MAG: hypothetical protein AAGB00_09465 [Planctomycetota bacterium]